MLVVRIRYLDHVNLRTTLLDRLMAFYGDVLGFSQGPRPDFAFDGAWFYCGEQADLSPYEP